tara:strand:- start:1290 stop:1745 length:456 start_codon:yes stop_codon:yes gene_type:complete
MPEKISPMVWGEGGLPPYFKNPFTDSLDLYRTSEIFERLTLNDLIVIPLSYIALRNARTYPISTNRVLTADIRYPPIIYKAKFDPKAGPVEREYCVFDGTHRISKMLQEGIKGAACFVITPKVFDGLEAFLDRRRLFRSNFRSTGCNQCEE